MEKGAALLLTLCLSTIRPAFADVNWSNTGAFALGFLSGVVVHEAGHAAMAVAQGSEVSDFGFDSVNATGTDPATVRTTAMGGYLAQSIATEMVLRSPGLHHNPYALGLMSMGIYVNLSNVARYYLTDSHTDLSTYGANGGDVSKPADLMVIYSLYTLYRVTHDTDIVPYFNHNIIGISFNF